MLERTLFVLEWSEMLLKNYSVPEVPNFAVFHESDIDYMDYLENITLVVNYDYPKKYNKRINKFHKCAAIHTLFTKEDSPNAKHLIKVLMERKQVVPIKLENLNTKYLKMLPPSKALETGDIDSLVKFIEGKSLGAVPKRKPKEKVPISKRLKIKTNRKYEEKENIVAPKKSGHALTQITVIEQSNAIRIDEDADIKRTSAANNSNPGNFYQQTKNSQPPIKAPETKNLDKEQKKMLLEAKEARIEDMKLESIQLMTEKARMEAGLSKERASLAECNRLFAETVDIDSLVEFIEGKPLGAVPKRKSKEKLPIGKKLKNKSKRKCEEKSKATTENTPQKSEYILTQKTVIEESDARIDEDAPMLGVKSSNKSSLENFCLEVNQEVLQTSENLNTAKGDNNQSNNRSPDNAKYMYKKIQARKMELQKKLQQMEEKKTNINKAEDDLVLKHSKEMAKVLNFKTEAENDMQEKCKKLNVINSEMCST